MQMQLAVLCLLGMSAVVATKNIGGCSLELCRRNLGVYYLPISLPQNPTEYDVVTFHEDGAFNVISSLANGNATAQIPAFSNTNGVWTCDGPNKITVNSFVFIYPIGQTPRSLGKVVFKLVFNQNGRVSGEASFTVYDLKSTENQDQSQWIPLVGPTRYNVQGYKLFNTCDQ